MRITKLVKIWIKLFKYIPSTQVFFYELYGVFFNDKNSNCDDLKFVYGKNQINLSIKDDEEGNKI